MSLYIEKINSKYYFRLRVPADMVSYLGCCQIRKALKTSDYSCAKSLARSMLYATEKLFSQIRGGFMTEEQIWQIAHQYKPDVLEGLSNKRRKQGASAYLPKCMQQDMASGKLSLSADEIIATVIEINQARREGLRKSLQFNDYGSTRAMAKQIFTDHNTSNNDNFELLCEYLLKAELRITSVIIERMKGNFNNPHDNLSERLATTSVVKAQPKSLRLSELWEEYCREKKDTGRWRTGTFTRYQAAFNAVIDIIGDKQLVDIDRTLARFLKTSLEVYPNKKEDKPAFKGKPFSKKMAEHKDFEPLSISSINYVTGLMSGMFRHAITENIGGITYNPFEKLQLKDNGDESTKRDSYATEDIKGLYLGLSTVIQGHPEKFWVPIIGLYTGMRLEEVCQLKPEDIEEVEGIHFFNICHKPELRQTTKTEQSRTCPVHPVLLDLGFIQFINAQKKTKSDRLFSRLTYNDKKECWNLIIGRWYNRTFEPKYISADEKKSFHSLRHTFIDWFKQKVDLSFTQKDVLKSIVGHEGRDDKDSGGITFERYGKAYEIARQYELLKQLDYGVDLELLKRDK